MPIEADAIYENGLLKLDHTLPLAEHQRVRVIIEPSATVARSSYGLLGWQGDPDIVRKVALEPDYGVLGAP